ncbi:MAG: LVIVD repeat-containing protein [Thermoleophilaceae bacterium]
MSNNDGVGAASRNGRRRRRSRLPEVLLVAAAAVFLAVGLAQGQLPGPLNDLFAVGQGNGDSPTQATVQQNQEPPFTPTPVQKCGPGSRPEPSVDGRVPAGSADHGGLICNLTLVGHQGTEGGFKVQRYVDGQGHECAYYDTTLQYPLNAFNPGAGSSGVTVLDMSDPAHPKQTATLTTPATLTPHESLNINTKRGLLAAVSGNLATYPGWFSIYDIHDDCRHPVLDGNGPYARFGHESGFSTDGKTFYATSTALQSITAIDVTDPKTPHVIWQGAIYSHGMSLSDDGNRAYIADPHHQLLILDTSEIQARKPDPKTREISRLTWKGASIPQNAIPFTENGHPYLLETDEYTQGTTDTSGDRDLVGAGRIIDISDEKHPFVVSNLRLAVDQPAEHKAAEGDPGASMNSGPQGYAGHYCNFDSEVNPKIVACSFIASGLRVFDISNLQHPTELGYFVAEPKPRSENGYTNSDFAMSKPAFDIARHNIWWTDGTTGFYVLHVKDGYWPGGNTAKAPPQACKARAPFLVRIRVPHGAKVRRATATLAGKRARIVRRHGRYYAKVDLRRVRTAKASLVTRVRLKSGRLLKRKRSFSACAAGRA